MQRDGLSRPLFSAIVCFRLRVQSCRATACEHISVKA